MREVVVMFLDSDALQGFQVIGHLFCRGFYDGIHPFGIASIGILLLIKTALRCLGTHFWLLSHANVLP